MTSPLPAKKFLAPALACLFLSGCIVLEERLIEKQSEADTLREGIAQSNRKGAACEARGESLSRELAAARKACEELSARVKEQGGELDRIRGRLTETKKDYEGTTISREELIRELLEKEKATGAKIQGLSLKAAGAEEKAEALRKELGEVRSEAEARRAEAEELRRSLDAKPSDEEIRRERDLLIGRVARLAEDRRSATERRGGMIAAIAAKIPSVAPYATVSVRGTVLRVTLPPPPRKGKEEPPVPGEWAEAAAAAAEPFREEQGSILVIAADGKGEEALRKGALEAGKFPPEGVVSLPSPSNGGAEIVLIAP